MQHRDTLRRHCKKCSRGEHYDEIPTSKRGRKPRACDLCRTKKAQCNGIQPCERCSSDHVECSYSYANDRLAPNNVEHDSAFHRNSQSADERTGDVRHAPVTFLLDYTNPSFES